MVIDSYFTYNFTTELNYEIQITTLGINLSLQTDPSKNLQDQLNMIGVEGDPNDTELFPLANFNPVCVVDVVRTDHEGKEAAYTEPEVVAEPPLEVIEAIPEVEVIQTKEPQVSQPSPPPRPPSLPTSPPVTEKPVVNEMDKTTPEMVDIGEPPPPNPDPELGPTGQAKLKSSTVTFDSTNEISAMDRTETISKSQQGSPVAPPRIKGRAARPSQKIRKPEIIGEVIKPIDGFTGGWDDSGGNTMGWGGDEETPTQSNVGGEDNEISQVISLKLYPILNCSFNRLKWSNSAPRSMSRFRSSTKRQLKLRSAPSQERVRYYFFFSKKDSFFCVYCLIITRVGEKRKLCRLDTTAFNNDLSTKVIGIPDEDKQETLMRLVGSSSQPPVDTIRPINDFDAGLSSLFKPQFNI